MKSRKLKYNSEPSNCAKCGYTSLGFRQTVYPSPEGELCELCAIGVQTSLCGNKYKEVNGERVWLDTA